MKISPIIAGILTISALQAQNEPGIMIERGYGLERYAKLLKDSPFDLPAPPKAPDIPVPPLENWALAGLTRNQDYTIATLVNLKTQERLRLAHYQNPPSSTANQTKSGGDVFSLESVEFGTQPPSVRSAEVTVKKNGESGVVKFDPKVLQLKPVAAAVVPPGTQGAQPPKLIPTPAKVKLPQ